MRNPSYSLRSFAKDLGYDASNLCKYLNGSSQISEKFYLNIKKQLQLSQETLEQFERENTLLYSEKSIFYISDENLSILGGEQCLLLLEILHLSHFEKTTLAISKYLNLPVQILENTLNFLAGLNIVISEEGHWRHTGQIVKLQLLPKSNDEEDLARAMARKITGQLVQSLDSDPSQRVLNWSLVATDSKLLPEAKRKLANYREDILSFLEGAEDKNTIFSYVVGLHPVDLSLEKAEE
nr:TIGR02147 family protein [Bacteriovorax sp. HI3]